MGEVTMHDPLEGMAEKLRALKGIFDPTALSHIGHGPENTLTLDQVNALQKVAEELRSIRGSLEELIGVIDECNPARMEQLAESDKVQAVANFNFDAHQQAAFEEIDHGDEEKLESDQGAAAGKTIDKLNELVEDAKPELQELHELVEGAVQKLDDAT